LLRSRTGVLELVDLGMQRSALSSRDRLSDPRRGGPASGDVRTRLRPIRADDKAHRSLGVLRHGLTTGFQYQSAGAAADVGLLLRRIRLYAPDSTQRYLLGRAN